MTDISASIKIPTTAELETKSLEELSDLLQSWGPLYARRFNLDDNDEYAALAHFYVSCSMMRENLANGWRRMWRITIPVTESRWEDEREHVNDINPKGPSDRES